MNSLGRALEDLRAVSLRGRVMLAVLGALVVGLPPAGAFAVWQGRRSVEIELRAALQAAATETRACLEEPACAPDLATGGDRLIQRFEGARHLRGRLVDETGATVRRSTPAPSRVRPPPWFVRAFDPSPEPIRLPVPPGRSPIAAVVIDPDPANEVGEVWQGYRNGLVIAGLYGLVALVLVLPAVARALRPLSSVSTALGRIAEGDYRVRVAEAGSRETLELARGFNAMAARLERMDADNRRLTAQMLTLQEEERTELARDLHDEMGPYLFAAGLDAAAARDLARAGRTEEAAARADLISAAVAHVQGHVRDMLARLRPARAVELGLGVAIEDLAAFWRARRPEVEVRLDLEADEADLAPAEREALYRVAQEALSNAMRHGRPSRVALSLRTDAAGGRVLEIADDGGAASGATQSGRYGLLGMRERLEGLGGGLAVDQDAQGWRILASTPRRPAARPHRSDRA